MICCSEPNAKTLHTSSIWRILQIDLQNMLMNASICRIFCVNLSGFKQYNDEIRKKRGGKQMDTRQIEYILKISEERSVTRAAEQLFITQSALSQQVQKLEKELGTSLFFRTKADWTPTPEGEIYLENARKILRIKQDTYSMIADRVNSRKSYLSIGITPEEIQSIRDIMLEEVK